MLLTIVIKRELTQSDSKQRPASAALSGVSQCRKNAQVSVPPPFIDSAPSLGPNARPPVTCLPT